MFGWFEGAATAIRRDSWSASHLHGSAPPKQMQQSEDDALASDAQQQSPLAGMPPAKQAQQEEIVAPLDEEEREALERRLARRRQQGAGRFATARLASPRYGGGSCGASASPTGVHSSWFQNRELTATGGELGDGESASYDAVPSSGYGRGFSARGYSSARQAAGLMTPSQFRQIQASARRESELRAAKTAQTNARERARRAARQAAAKQSARQAIEEERREEARQAIREREANRALAAESASARYRSGGGGVSAAFGHAKRAAASSARPNGDKRRGGKKPPSPPSHSQLPQTRELLPGHRPRWGHGHAGGHKLASAPSASTAASTQLLRALEAAPDATPAPPPRPVLGGKGPVLAPHDIGPGWV